VIWERGRITARDLKCVLYPNGSRSHYEFLKGLLSRMERKGFVKRDRKPSAHQFESKIDRDVLIGRCLQTIADKLCDGSMDPLLQHLVYAQFNADQLNIIRDLLNETSEENRATVLNT
jgi:predicted transcriptional regulator